MPSTTWTRRASSPTSPRTKSSAQPAPRAPITAGGDTQQHVVVVFDNHPGTKLRRALMRAGSSCRP
ncbi:hypothetical protein T492DRAFT_953660 [Pavlovales sp. CCMP2436]|nr:hypothetical protein T492DRAFT_953660 [Pavlovales sp. CCMP2436]